MKLSVPVASGVEASVKRQLKQLGYGDCPALQGRIRLEGGWQDVARLNVNLRAGERVLIELAQFPAPDFDALFEGVRAIPWEEYLGAHSRILMDGKCVESKLMAIKASGGVAKKAIVERLRAKLGVNTLDERGSRAVVGIFIVGDRASVTLDTTGDGLHKRGYRVRTYSAPLRETTAAAMVESSFFRAGKPFADVFCGSGTIPIEAALYMRSIAPGRNRTFDFAHWQCAPGVLEVAREEARDLENHAPLPPIEAGDISREAVEIAKFHAARAGVADDIRFCVRDMRAFTSGERCGVMISNPPYGERLKASDLQGLYRDFGKMYRSLPDWSCYFLSSYEGAERTFGGRAEKKRRLWNAGIACTLYSYFGAPPAVKSL